MTSKTIVNTLKSLGVNHVFGYTGGAILPLVNQFFKTKGPRLVVPQTELGAGFMAEGYAKMTNNTKPGVVLATSGPGSTNLVTSLQNAFMDGTPLIALTGQVSTNVLGTQAFQEADTLGITRPCTKYNVMLKSCDNPTHVVTRAYNIAMAPRKGPVLIDIPKNVSSNLLTNHPPKFPTTNIPPNNSTTNIPPNQHLEQINAIKEFIRSAKRPVILAGQGSLSSYKQLRDYAQNNIVPVSTTLLGLGAVDETKKGALQMAGMHGNYAANMAIQSADLLICLGTRLDDRIIGNPTTFGKSARIIHVDSQPSAKHRTVQNTTFIHSTVHDFLRELPHCNQSTKSTRIKWVKHLESLKQTYPFPIRHTDQLTGSYFLSQLNKFIHSNNMPTCIVSDVGAHQMWTAQFIDYQFPRIKFITSGGLGSMGFALSAAMGAKLAAPNYRVICIVGDGGFNMSLHELRTAVNHSIDIKVIVLNNGYQQMVRMWQDLFYDKRYIGVKNSNPRFDHVAQALGIDASRLDNLSDINDSIYNLFSSDKAMLIDAIIDSQEYVYPMVLPGSSLHEMKYLK